MLRFQDKVALVTGSTGGIGLAIARRLAADGARLALVAHHADELTSAADQVRQAGAPDVWATACDVGVEAQVEAAVAGTLARYGRLDVVVNCAGLMEFKPLAELSTDDWQRALNVDLFGAFYFTRLAFKHMKPGGSIVNVSSIHAYETSPNVAPYAAAKAALGSLTRSAAIEGQPLGIRVNAVLPGAIDTPMLRDNPNVKSGVEKIDEHNLGQPDNVAEAVAYLASEAATFVQGTELRVDGGRLVRLN